MESIIEIVYKLVHRLVGRDPAPRDQEAFWLFTAIVIGVLLTMVGLGLFLAFR